MGSYQLKIKRSAEKELANFDVDTVIAINERILILRNNPLPSGYKKLKGFKNLYRIRVGNYRIIYSVQHDILIIEILKIAHRKDVYL
ncbi:MAG: type II toxin-antitoxin system RelE/ParE family toxin [Bacteroidota bacterium]|nr:type II toxin-antitoxin system RelE/ParE family toxin [Bacteroidota bacterium]